MSRARRAPGAPSRAQKKTVRPDRRTAYRMRILWT
ncbi:putative lipoprotein [Burkholderia pseudomallei S13]|nr:putative lipoprotein [Burkholderia pseudomallei S13]